MRDYKNEKQYVHVLDRYKALKRGSRTVYVSRSGAVHSSDYGEARARAKRNSWHNGSWR